MFAAGEVGGNAEMKAAIVGGVVGAVVGGLFGGGFSVLATWQAHKHNLALERIQMQAMIDGILQAIRIEWDVMLKEYNWLGERLGEVQNGKAFTYFFKITRDYFIVYPNNTAIVGQINNSELCRQIVTAYTSANTFLDAIEVNNKNEERLQEFHKLQTTDPVLFQREHSNHYSRMVEFVPHLRESYQDLKNEAEKLAKAIDDYRQHHPVTKD